MKDSTRMRTYDGLIFPNTDRPMGPPAKHSREKAYRSVLEEIRDQDWIENVLDPQWAARIAEKALDD